MNNFPPSVLTRLTTFFRPPMFESAPGRFALGRGVPVQINPGTRIYRVDGIRPRWQHLFMAMERGQPVFIYLEPKDDRICPCDKLHRAGADVLAKIYAPQPQKPEPGPC